MEFFLNTIWLLVAVGAFAGWRPQARRATCQVGRTGVFPAVVALACALLLLFPVISLTDDLHSEQFPMEDSSRSAAKVRSLVHTASRAPSPPFLASLTTALNPAAVLHVVWGAVVLFEAHPFCLIPVSIHHGRAPPSIF